MKNWDNNALPHNHRIIIVKIISSLLLLLNSLILFSQGADEQQTVSQPFYFKLLYGFQLSFGPDNNQAEITGGTDSLYYDNKEHLVPGFKDSHPFDLIFGYRGKFVCLEGTMRYFRQDIGLVKQVYQSESQFIMADMLTIKTAIIREKDCCRSLFSYAYGFFVSTTFPAASRMNEQIKNQYMIESFEHRVQLNWGLDLNAALNFRKTGISLLIGMGGTMPGIIGRIGKIDMQSGSPYSTTHPSIKMYSFQYLIGAKYRFGKSKN